MRSAPALLCALALVTLAGCDRAKPKPQETTPVPSTSPPPTTTAAPLSVSVAFCAYGGNGVIPSDASPDDFYRALAWVVVQSSGNVSDLALRAVEISGDAGIESTMKRIESIERLEPAAPLEPPGVWQSRGKAFDGKLAPGETRLRIEVWLTKRPRSRPSTLRIELGGGAVTSAGTCKLTVEWPTG